jgi:membrane protein required for colicin V production
MHSNLPALTNFDYIISGIVFLSTIIAIVRGFLKSAISLAGWCVSILIGMKFYFLLMPIISKYIAFEALAATCSAFVLFLISAIIIAIINNIFYMLLSVFCGGVLDKSAGALFGFVRGCLIVCAGFYVMLMIMPQLDPNHKAIKDSVVTPPPSWAKNARVISLLIKGASLIDYCIPLDFRNKINVIFSAAEAGIEKKAREDVLNHTNKITDILNALPKDVLKSIPSEELVMLQDATVPDQDKAKILADIKKLYEEYMNIQMPNLSQTDISQRDLRYYETMIMIESAINEYDRMLMAPGMPSSDVS